MAGVVYLVGAGPGDPGLVTVRGAECLRLADVVVADHLAPPQLLALAPTGAEVHVRGARRSGLTQDEIERLLVDKARAGKVVVRLKGGDPFVFGRGGEEAETLRAAGIAVEIVPGVSAGIAAPAYAGIPLTHRGIAGAVAFATGHEADKDAGHVPWEALAAGATTLVLYMSVERLEAAMRRLVDAGCPPSRPAAVISHGTRASQRTVVGTVSDIAARVAEARLATPALTVVGEVVSLRASLSWFESRPLHGARVVVTRAAGQAEGTARLLEERGAEVLLAPAIEIAPPEDLAPLDAALGELARFGLVAVASANAVTSLFARLEALGRDARALAGKVVAAVGAHTAEVLSAHGIRADLVAEEATAEGLARALSTVTVQGDALVPRAAEGREALLQALGARGLTVVAPVAYRSIPVARERLAWVAAAIAAGTVDAVTFGSPRTAQALVAALDDPRALARTLVAAIGPTTARALADLGVRVDLVPRTAGFDALVDELAPLVRQRLASRP